MKDKETPGTILKSLQFIYTFLFFSAMLIAAIALILENVVGIKDFLHPNASLVFSYISIALPLVLFLLSHLLPQRRLNRMNSAIDLVSKLENYKKACMIRFVLLADAAFIATLGFFITGNTDKFFLVAIALLLFILNRPSRFKIISDLNLDSTQAEELTLLK